MRKRWQVRRGDVSERKKTNDHLYLRLRECYLSAHCCPNILLHMLRTPSSWLIYTCLLSQDVSINKIRQGLKESETPWQDLFPLQIYPLHEKKITKILPVKSWLHTCQLLQGANNIKHIHLVSAVAAAGAPNGSDEFVVGANGSVVDVLVANGSVAELPIAKGSAAPVAGVDVNQSVITAIQWPGFANSFFEFFLFGKNK